MRFETSEEDSRAMDGDEATGDVQIIDQPLVPINTVTFDDIPFYGRDRISAVLDQALQSGVPADVIDEAKSLSREVYLKPTAPRRGTNYWGQDPGGRQAAREAEDYDRFEAARRSLRDFFIEKFLTARELPGSRSFTVTIPIFVIGSAEPKKSKVSMRYTDLVEDKTGFELKIFGSGLGTDKKCDVTIGEEYTCENGKGRRGDLELPILATPYGFNLGTGPKVVGWSWEKDDSRKGQVRIADCEGNQLTSLSGEQNGDDQNLDDTAAKVTLNRSIESWKSFDFSVGVSKGTDFAGKVSFSLKASRKVELTIDLPGRHTYRCFAPREGIGSIWRVV
jgi:hypothetical protein